MIVQCKGCQKKLEVDATKFIHDRMRGKCPACQTIIEVEKPGDTAAMPEPAKAESHAPRPDRDNPPPVLKAPARKKAGGLTIGKKLLLLFLAFILVTGGVLTFLYTTYLPSLMYDQISLRTFSIAQSFSGAIREPLLIKNYLLVNQTAATNAKLPHVAYVSVLNKRGIVIAGIFGNTSEFDPEFKSKVETTGFPKEISSKNRIPAGVPKSFLDFTVGGQRIYDVAVPIGDTGGEAHVGVFTRDVEKAVQKSLIPMLALLAVMVVGGSFCFYLVARSISAPVKALTRAAEKISIGEMDHPIEVRGGGEIQELADSLERMRFSINAAMARLMEQ